VLAAFAPGRQRFSRALSKFSFFGTVLRASYDLLFQSWFRHVRAARVGKSLVQSGEVGGGQIQSFLGALVPNSPEVDLVRIGPKGDGGYLVPSDWHNVDALFSPGIAGSSAFEFPYAQRGTPCYLADASVDGPAEDHPNFFFKPLFLGAETKDKFISLSDWMSLEGVNSKNLALQMDIEGSEWEVFASTDSELLSRFRYIVIELHNLDRLTSRSFLAEAEDVLSKLQSSHFVAHVHGNNYGVLLNYDGVKLPEVLELTLLRRTDYKCGSAGYFQHLLDQPNNPRFREVDLSQVFGEPRRA
jgi:hypothetical protein